MAKLLISFVTLLVLLHATQSQQVIDGTWTDDFAHDDSGLTGWQIYNGDTGDLGNPIIQGDTYKFHGLFTRQNYPLDSQYHYLSRYFSCNRRSTVFISFYYAFCDESETSDYVKVRMNNTFSPLYNMKEEDGGIKLDTIEGSTFQNALPSDIDSACDIIGEWWYKTVSDFSAGSVEKETPFLITFTGKVTSIMEYWALFNLEIECVALPTTEPTPEPSAPSTEPTIDPSMIPSVNPTSAPSASPSAPPSASPSASPTLTPLTAPTQSPTKCVDY
eukprot:871835_1